MMEQDVWGVGEAAPEVPSSPQMGRETEELPWRWGPVSVLGTLD